MLRIINHKVLQSRTAAILVVLLFTVGNWGCVTTLGYVPEQIKPRHMADKITLDPKYSEVKEWAYDVVDGYDSRATLNRYSLYGGALLAAVAVGAIAGLTAFDTGSSVVKGFAIGGPVLGSILAIYSSEEKARLYRLASSYIKELITLSDKRLFLCLNPTSRSVQEAKTMEEQAAGNLDAAKQKENILGEEMQKARKNADNASPSDKQPALQEVASAIDQKLREARKSVLVAEAEILAAHEDLNNAERCSKSPMTSEPEDKKEARLQKEEALCLRNDVDGIMAKVEGHIAQLDPRNVTEQLESVKADAAKLTKAGGKEADPPIKAPTDLSDISPPVKSSCGVF